MTSEIDILRSRIHDLTALVNKNGNLSQRISLLENSVRQKLLTNSQETSNKGKKVEELAKVIREIDNSFNSEIIRTNKILKQYQHEFNGFKNVLRELISSSSSMQMHQKCLRSPQKETSPKYFISII